MCGSALENEYHYCKLTTFIQNSKQQPKCGGCLKTFRPQREILTKVSAILSTQSFELIDVSIFVKMEELEYRVVI